MSLFTAYGVLLLCLPSLGQKINNFLQQHRGNVEDYIMVGHGRGWTQCDVLSSNSAGDDAPQLLMKFVEFQKLDMRSTLSSCHCLLASYHIESQESLSEIIQFGWEVIKHKRIALILSMAKGITLEMATDTDKLPFLVAAQLESGEKQFLCPVIGKITPLMQSDMCDISYVSYKYKKLKIGLLGVPPHLVFDGGIDGTDVRLIKLLAEKLKFQPDVVFPRTYAQGENMVRNAKVYLYRNKIAIKVISVSLERN